MEGKVRSRGVSGFVFVLNGRINSRFVNGNNLAGKELLVMKKRCQSSVLEHKRRGGHGRQGAGSSACAWGQHDFLSFCTIINWG